MKKYCNIHNDLYLISPNGIYSNSYHDTFSKMFNFIENHMKRTGDKFVIKLYEHLIFADYSNMNININGCHLVHGDLHFDNIMVSNDDMYLLDWEEYEWTEPLMEFSKIVIAYDVKLRKVLVRLFEKNCIYDTTYLKNLMELYATYNICEYKDYFGSVNVIDSWTKYRFNNYIEFMKSNI